MQEHIAYVLDIHGKWSISGSDQILTQGQSVPPGVRIVKLPSQSSTNVKITLLYRDHTTSPRCEDSCTEVSVRQSLETTRWIDRAKDALFKLVETTMTGLSRDPARYASLRSRGRGLQDSVVRLKGTTVDFGPALKHAEPERYALRLSPINPARSRPLESAPFQWRTAQSGSVGIKGVSPGLYECRLLITRYGQLDDTGQSAWVLIADTTTYDEVSASFTAAAKMTEEWGTGIDDETTRAFLRAALDSLASPVAR